MTLKLRLPKVHVRPRWESTTIRTLGILEIVFGLLLLVPAALAFYLGEQPRIFLEPVPFLLILGTAQLQLFKEVAAQMSKNLDEWGETDPCTQL